MGAILAMLLPMVPGIINGIESIFASKPKSGTDKMAAAVQALRVILGQAQAAGVPVSGVVPTALPTDDALMGMIETEFQKLKASGQLGATSAPAGGMYILQGSISAISALKLQ